MSIKEHIVRNIYQKASKHILLLVEEVLHDNRSVI